MNRSVVVTGLEPGMQASVDAQHRTGFASTSMRTAISLLTAAERALRPGRTADALESVAALAYLRSAKRRPPRRASLR